MRTKESADDYRYFPEPDLPPLVVSKSLIDEIKKTLPELPKVKRERFINKVGLSEYFADLLIADKALCDFFESGVKTCKNPKAFCNWVTVEFTARANELNKHIQDLQLLPENIAALVNLIDKGRITGKMAKEIADLMIKSPEKKPEDIADSDDRFKPMSDTSALEEIIEKVVKENPDSIEDYKNGKDKAFSILSRSSDETDKRNSTTSASKRAYHKKNQLSLFI